MHLDAPLARGGTLRFYTDSGGGLFVTEAAAKRLALPAIELPAGSDAPPGARGVHWPALRDSAIPSPPGDGVAPVMGESACAQA